MSSTGSWRRQTRPRGPSRFPMEPYDFPDSDPGQYTLRSGVTEIPNTQRSVWALTRFTGAMRARPIFWGTIAFGRNRTRTGPDLSLRAVGFCSSTMGRRCIRWRRMWPAASVCRLYNLPTPSIRSKQPWRSTTVCLQLETEARTKGSASGAGFLYPVTIDRVAKWAQGLSGRGFVLVPVLAIVTQAKQ